jgi:hypothetical protein
VAANFMNRNSMQPMRSCVMEREGLPFSLVSVGGGAVFYFQVWRVDCPLFTFLLDSGHSTFHASFIYLFVFEVGGVRGGR